MIRRASAFLFIAIITMLVVSSAAQAQPQELMTRHVRDAVLSGRAQYRGRLPASQSLRFDAVLALRHQPELEDFLEELYDPASPSYQHYVTVKEFTGRFGPSQGDYEAVVGFAKANGLEIMGGSRDAMDVQLRGTVSAVERAFHITMGLYQHPTENRAFYAPDREPTVDLPFQLWHISGLDNYSIPHPLVRHRDVAGNSEVSGSCPGGYYCGSDMRVAYYGGTALTGAGQTLGLFEFAGYNIADVNQYFKTVGQPDNVPVVGISTDGTSLTCVYRSTGCDDVEQTLDITQAISMAPGLTGLYFYVGSTDTAILSAMSTNKPLNAQLSSSWAWVPADPTTDDPYFEKFAAQGQSFFQASGDAGAYDYYNSPYVFPADDDYVIAVGGTDLLTASAGGAWASETAWNYSAGGISPDDIKIPSWQKPKGVITTENAGSKTLRNYPDVAAEANFDFYVCGDGACGAGLGGTSFAAPMWAGYMALMNQQAVVNGYPALGFINSTIYKLGVGSGYASEFHDVTSGSNDCYGQTPYWTAGVGYDLVTGWGSPNGAGLINTLAGSSSVTPEFLEFGSEAVGKTSSRQTVTLTNTGGRTLTVKQVAVSGDFNLVKGKSNCAAGKTVKDGAKCTIEVTFTPTETGSRAGDLTITENTNGLLQVPLYGTGQ
jgi:kumamolisin